MPNLASWTRREDKAFENAIATHSFDKSNEQWDKLASMVPTKTVEEIKEHYEFLVEDVVAIEAGKVPLPKYGNDEITLSTSTDKDDNNHPPVSKDQRGKSNQGNGCSAFGPSAMENSSKSSSKLDQERKKGIPWTEEEHRLFLLGLDKFGKGDWRSISRNFVITRTPTQVASHAQKYYIRLNSMNRDRRRSSIHDITSVNAAGLSSNQVQVTGQQRSNTGAPALGTDTAPTPTDMHRAQHSVNMVPPVMGMYGTQIGQPVAAAPPARPQHMVSAVGTPVMLPHPGHPQHLQHHPPPHYAVPVAYPVVPPPMHR